MEGFLPRKGAARSARLAELAVEERTMVLFESPHRLAATLADLGAAFGAGRPACVAREMTKLHEEFVRGTLEELAAWAAQPPKGEVVLVVGGEVVVVVLAGGAVVLVGRERVPPEAPLDRVSSCAQPRRASTRNPRRNRYERAEEAKERGTGGDGSDGRGARMGHPALPSLSPVERTGCR